MVMVIIYIYIYNPHTLYLYILGFHNFNMISCHISNICEIITFLKVHIFYKLAKHQILALYLKNEFGSKLREAHKEKTQNFKIHVIWQ